MRLGGLNQFLGKYREIVIAVAFFLVFDLAVLLLNVFISVQVTADATAINISGRQRMLSQRMSKAVLVMENNHRQGLDYAEQLQELQKSSALFDRTLQAFVSGGNVPGGDNREVYLKPVESEQGRALLQQASAEWQPLLHTLTPLLSGKFSSSELAQACNRVTAHNLALLNAMNGLTSQLEREARTRGERLWMAQGIGILLALVNFGLILFKFIGKLRENDRVIEAAKQETDEILATVQEGLFLLNRDFHLGGQVSASLPKVLGRSVGPASNFLDLLQGMVPSTDFNATRDYLELLFGDRVKESLVRELNPLSEVEVRDRDERFGVRARYLSFHFNRVLSAEQRISHLLVTVQDISESVQLRQDLLAAKQIAKTEVEVLLDLLSVNPALLTSFLVDARHSLENINKLLRGAGGNYRLLLDQLFRQMHALKGDAAALGFTLFEQMAHEFEDRLQSLREKSDVSGDDLLALLPQLDGCFARIQQVSDMLERFSTFHRPAVEQSESQELVLSLQQLASRIGESQQKQVTVNAELSAFNLLPLRQRAELRDIAIQLLRNAVTHGIEPGEERSSRAKAETGNIRVKLRALENNEFEFELIDDGRGIIPSQIRVALLRSGRYSPTHLAELDDKQVVMKIFDQGFSTVPTAGVDAGRGVGMDIVREKIKNLGGHLRLSSKPHEYTAFHIRFAV